MDERDREGHYYSWVWNHTRLCWEAFIPLRIYPQEGGAFSVSTGGVWHAGEFQSFEAAEAEAVNA